MRQGEEGHQRCFRGRAAPHKADWMQPLDGVLMGGPGTRSTRQPSVKNLEPRLGLGAMVICATPYQSFAEMGGGS